MLIFDFTLIVIQIDMSRRTVLPNMTDIERNTPSLSLQIRVLLYFSTSSFENIYKNVIFMFQKFYFNRYRNYKKIQPCATLLFWSKKTIENHFFSIFRQQIK